VIKFDRSTLAQTAVAVTATLAATTLAGAILAYWTWAWFAPRQELLLRPARESVSSAGAAAGLFGSARPGRISRAVAGGQIRLLGLVTASPGRRGYAVLQLDSRQILAVHEGAEISPGVRLSRVAVDHAVVERAGSRESIAWPIKDASTPPLARSPQKQ
jgi:general secretion pathway protein C